MGAPIPLYRPRIPYTKESFPIFTPILHKNLLKTTLIIEILQASKNVNQNINTK